MSSSVSSSSSAAIPDPAEPMMHIAALQKEYEVLMTRYQEAVQTHIADLQQAKQTRWVALPGRTWWGDKGLKEGPADTQQQCEALCASQGSACSGATFNAKRRYCWTRASDANGGGAPVLSTGLPSDTALVRQATLSLLAMESLNDRLLQLNQQIQDAWAQAGPPLQQQAQVRAEQQARLAESYRALKRQQQTMKQQLAAFETAQQTQENGQLWVEQQYAWVQLGWGLAAIGAAIAARYWLRSGASVSSLGSAAV